MGGVGENEAEGAEVLHTSSTDLDGGRTAQNSLISANRYDWPRERCITAEGESTFESQLMAGELNNDRRRPRDPSQWRYYTSLATSRVIQKKL